MNVITAVGKNLHSIRKRKNYTIRVLSDLAGISKNQISKIEQGEADPRISTLYNLALALDVDISDFFKT